MKQDVVQLARLPNNLSPKTSFSLPALFTPLLESPLGERRGLPQPLAVWTLDPLFPFALFFPGSRGIVLRH